MSVVRPPTFKAEPLLPPVGDVFREHFLSQDGKTLKNKLVLGKRLQGLISYYKGSKKELMPLVTKDEVVRVPFSPYAQAPDNCCGNGCQDCVWNDHWDKLQLYEKRLKELQEVNQSLPPNTLGDIVVSTDGHSSSSTENISIDRPVVSTHT